jgi:anaerobic nitric oxide reductase flavorubredoxin
MQIVKKYAEWAADYQEDQITVVYDTMWNGTRTLADTIAEGIRSADPKVAVKVFNITKSDVNDVITEVFRSKTVVIGSPTISRSILHSIAGFLHLVKELKFRNKSAAAFGCYGWSGEGVGELNKLLQDAGFRLIDPGFRNMWNPDGDALDKAHEFGKKIAAGQAAAQ